MVRRKRTVVRVQLFCPHCTNNESSGRSFKRLRFNGNLYTDSKTNTKEVQSSGLRRHFDANNECWEYYSNHEDFNNYSDCIVQPTAEQKQVDNQLCLLSHQLGLTNTTNGPCVDSEIDNAPIDCDTTNTMAAESSATLNQQVLYNGLLPRFHRSLIESIAEDEKRIVNDNSILPPVIHDDNPQPDNPVDTLSTQVQVQPQPVPPPMTSTLKPSSSLVAEIKLHNLMTKHKMPLNAFKTIFNWAISCQSDPTFDFAQIQTPRSRKSMLKDVASQLQYDTEQFEPQCVRLLPDNLLSQIFVRPYRKALYSLLQKSNIVCEGNFSFPNHTTPYSYTTISHNDTLSELHHGKWWAESWKKECDTDSNINSKEILVPVILYMDGIAIDKNMQHSLTPLNMTLGIFNTATRRRAEAWETLYFHPSKDECLNQSSSPSGYEKAQNLHRCLDQALKSLRELCESKEPVVWKFLPYAGRIWEVHMKFAIAYVIGDTSEHDKLCGRYSNYNKKLACLCRHCSCPSALGINPYYNTMIRGKYPDPTFKLFSPLDFKSDSNNQDEKYFQSVSHHCIDNAFHKLPFGAGNPNNIHFGTPGESLHMHKLGVEKRIIEQFKNFVSSQDSNHSGRAFRYIQLVGKLYYSILSRQSDRNFPKTGSKFDLNSDSRREGNDFAGIILCTILAMLSNGGTNVLLREAFILRKHIHLQIELMELVLGLDRFLTSDSILASDVECLPLFLAYFVNLLDTNIHRDKGSGNVTTKNHLYFHLPRYIELWGPPCGWDSSFNESHHKTEVKAPAKNTQARPSLLIQQTIHRMVENRMLQNATSVFNISINNHNKSWHSTCANGNTAIAGAKFVIKFDESGLVPRMDWIKSENHHKPHHPQDVIAFCCNNVLPLIPDRNTLPGFTKHRRVDQVTGKSHIFRAHPSYHGSSGQALHVWYDWAKFNMDGSQIPCQILCFVHLPEL